MVYSLVRNTGARLSIVGDLQATAEDDLCGATFSGTMKAGVESGLNVSTCNR